LAEIEDYASWPWFPWPGTGINHSTLESQKAFTMKDQRN